MPQNPAPSTLFVTKIIPGAGLSVSPDSGTGIVTIELGTAPGEAIPAQAYNAVATAPTESTLALTGANISGGSVLTVLNLTDAAAAASNAQLPTVAALIAALEDLGIVIQEGSSYELDIMNGANTDAWTVTTNTGWTLNGTMTIAENYVRKFIVTFATLTTATLQSLGTFAFGGI